MKVKEKTRMGRKPLTDEASRRNQKTAAYVTADEKTLLRILSTDYPYDGEADVLRQGLALLVQTRHPELAVHLRNDLKAVP